MKGVERWTKAGGKRIAVFPVGGAACGDGAWWLWGGGSTERCPTAAFPGSDTFHRTGICLQIASVSEQTGRGRLHGTLQPPEGARCSLVGFCGKLSLQGRTLPLPSAWEETEQTNVLPTKPGFGLQLLYHIFKQQCVFPPWLHVQMGMKIHASVTGSVVDAGHRPFSSSKGWFCWGDSCWSDPSSPSDWQLNSADRVVWRILRSKLWMKKKKKALKSWGGGEIMNASAILQNLGSFTLFHWHGRMLYCNLQKWNTTAKNWSQLQLLMLCLEELLDW